MGNDGSPLGQDGAVMECACNHYDGDVGLSPCGCHHWREEVARLRGVRQALHYVAVSEAKQQEIIKQLVPAWQYLDGLVTGPAGE